MYQFYYLLQTEPAEWFPVKVYFKQWRTVASVTLIVAVKKIYVAETIVKGKL